MDDDRVSDLRARWTPEATAAAVAFLESRPTNFDLPTMEQGGATYLDLRGLRIEETQIDKAFLRNVNLRWAVFKDVGFKNARFVGCNLSQVSFSSCYLRRAQFEKCDLVNSRFDSCDFSQAAMSECRIDFASFKNCEIRLDVVRLQKDAAPRAMVRVCRSLRLNAMSMGNFAEASELTYLEKTYRRLEHRQAGAWARWLGATLEDWLWGYGEKPWRLALALAAGLGAFAWFLDAREAPLGRAAAVLCAAAGIAAFGLLIAAVTKKIMYR